MLDNNPSPVVIASFKRLVPVLLRLSTPLVAVLFVIVTQPGDWDERIVTVHAIINKQGTMS
jgi:hypothetical protein